MSKEMFNDGGPMPKTSFGMVLDDYKARRGMLAKRHLFTEPPAIPIKTLTDPDVKSDLEDLKEEVSKLRKCVERHFNDYQLIKGVWRVPL